MILASFIGFVLGCALIGINFLLCLVETIIPIHLTLVSMGKSQTDKGISDMQKKWLVYWTIYGLIDFAELNLSKIFGLLPNWHYHKLIVLGLLMT